MQFISIPAAIVSMAFPAMCFSAEVDSMPDSAYEAGESTSRQDAASNWITGDTEKTKEQKQKQKQKNVKEQKSKSDNKKSKSDDGMCNEAQGKPKCPEPEVTYQPKFPPLGQYSRVGVCEPIHNKNDPTVQLRDGEHLQDALGRLKKKSGHEGGVIEIPWDVDTVQCDSLKISRNKAVRTLTLKGLPGRDGEIPRFYCRGVNQDGTVTKGGGGTFLLWGKNDPEQEPRLMVENIHLDGYGTWFTLPRDGKAIIRNNYAHHSSRDGITLSGITEEAPEEYGVDLEFCGNEFSHGGQGNAKHVFYLHRGVPGVSEIHSLLVDNVCHSSNYSSCYKSTANVNRIHNNRFYKTVPPEDYQPEDPTYRLEGETSFVPKYSSMLIDIPACSLNVIAGNYLYAYRPKPNDFGSGVMIGIRNRRSIHGCNIPRGFAGDNLIAERIPDSPFWTEEYWSEISGTYPLRTVVKRNIFENTGPDAKAQAIVSWGTYPNYALKSFGASCLLPAPEQWYERHRVEVSQNTYINFKGDSNTYVSDAPTHGKKCDYPEPETAKHREYDLFVIGEGEVSR